ncbi:MarR family transcriptional regulator [Thiorhodococcus minor]|uniref:MarR family transcriptional regulator n=2 Tax=Thiorhodococcus minor TaxID=57489 RepID=A0A6M0K8K0_9GAMM|nr:MarR family transcriptional regulator [Thiorhodococcus minor]
MNPFVEQHHDEISCVLSCFDRVVITGTFPEICHAKAMASYLGQRDIRLFDYTQWAEPLREEIRANAEHLAAEAGVQIEFIRKLKAFRKEDRVQAILAERGDHPGLVHIFSAMEACSSYRPWHDKASGKTFFKPISGKCLHYYFYFVDADFGLCYVRVPTWAPFRLQVYFNGHGWLARQLMHAGIAFDAADNAFVRLADPGAAQRLADSLDPTTLHQHLNAWAQRFCPVLGHFRSGVHWSFMQVEYATDVVFLKQAHFQPLYEAIVRTAVHVIKAEQVATFLGHKLTAKYQGEVGNDFSTRIQGTRIRHHMGPASIKLYDKAGIMARVECTANDVSFFKHHRHVEQRNGETVFKLAPLRKSIYSLNDLRRLMSAANERYLAFMACIDNPDAPQKALAKMAAPSKVKGRSFRGFDLFLDPDYQLFLTLARGEWSISGFRARDLREHIDGLSPSRASYLIKRLRTHGLIKKVGHAYKYFFTKLGRRVVTTALVIREYFVQPSLVLEAL